MNSHRISILKLSIWKTILLTTLFIFLFHESSWAIISENDKQLNKNIKTFIPVYCSTKSVPWEYWGKRYEFTIALSNYENLPLKPFSDLSNEFLGYKNKNTKINLICNKWDPVFDRILSSKVIATFEIDDLSKKITYSLDDLGPHKKVEINFSIARDMKNIEITESRAGINIFKKYKPTRVFCASFSVKDASQAGTIATYSKDSVCYNLK